MSRATSSSPTSAVCVPRSCTDGPMLVYQEPMTRPISSGVRHNAHVEGDGAVVDVLRRLGSDEQPDDEVFPAGDDETAATGEVGS